MTVRVNVRLHTGVYWRWVQDADTADPGDCQPQHDHPGRYHRVGDPGRWYGGSCPLGTWCEWRRYNTYLRKAHPVRMGCFRIADLRVIDLTETDVLRALGQDWEDLQKAADYGVTQDIADLFFRGGVTEQVDGLVAPSARCDAHTMLVVQRAALARHVTPVHGRSWSLQSPPHYLSRLRAYPTPVGSGV
ncbi:RES family NAD+ phosphorylase [Streptomyces sp. NBC_00519]|uniref:RES family NAD+ phosphorylase n=1 Tax=Streptomyces sp. NBC_00519 TaxID=2975764 RepID=UPI003869C2FE